jgi:DNA-binding transcriptional LysR family regulator
MVEAGIRLVPSFSSSSILAQARAVASGAGFALLPRYVAAAEPRLVPLLHDDVCIRFPLWLLIHADVATLTRVRAVADLLVKTFESE